MNKKSATQSKMNGMQNKTTNTQNKMGARTRSKFRPVRSAGGGRPRPNTYKGLGRPFFAYRLFQYLAAVSGPPACHSTSNSWAMRSFCPCRYNQPSRHSRPVEARYSWAVACLATLALLAFFAPAQHSGLLFGEQGFQGGQFPELSPGGHVLGGYAMQAAGLASRVVPTRRLRTRISSTASPTKARARGGHFL